MLEKVIKANVVLAESEKLFFKEVDFDFNLVDSQMPGDDNKGKRLFMVENITEDVKVKAYPTRDRAIMFNAWITKNIAYKVVKQEYDVTCTKISTIGVGVSDKNGYPTVYGPICHMTKVIDFGGYIEMDLPEGEVLKESDVIEVISAEVVGSHDELLNSEPIYEMNKDDIFQLNKYSIFDPELFQYAKLREKMCIKIKVRVIRNEDISINVQ